MKNGQRRNIAEENKKIRCFYHRSCVPVDEDSSHSLTARLIMSITSIYTLAAGETISHLQQAPPLPVAAAKTEGLETWRQPLSCVNEAWLNPQRGKNMLGLSKKKMSETNKGKLPSESKGKILGLPSVEKEERHQTSSLQATVSHTLWLKLVNLKLPKR